MGASFLIETQTKQALSSGCHDAWPGRWMCTVSQSARQTWSWRARVTAMNLALAYNHHVLTSWCLLPLPRTSFKQQGCPRQALLCSDSVWVEGTSACPGPTRCRIKGLLAGSSPPPSWDPCRLGVDFLAHWVLPSPGLVSFRCRFYYYSGKVTGDNRSEDNCHWKCSLLLTDPKRRGHITPWGPHRDSPGLVRRQREQGGNVGKSLQCGFQGKEWARQDSQV